MRQIPLGAKGSFNLLVQPEHLRTGSSSTLPNPNLPSGLRSGRWRVITAKTQNDSHVQTRF